MRAPDDPWVGLEETDEKTAEEAFWTRLIFEGSDSAHAGPIRCAATKEMDERVSEMSRLPEAMFTRGLSEGEAKAVAGYMATAGRGLDAALVALRIDEADRPAVQATSRTRRAT